jgi:cytochrome b pre-mRNA-processing protein 3
MLHLLRRSASRGPDIQTLYDAVVARARAPVFFRDFGVADSIDGRFDMVALHGWLALAQLKAAGDREGAQGLTDAIFTGFDEALREQGAGDMGLSRKIKAMADAFFGRLKAYDEAGDDDALAEALARNLYRGAPVDARARALTVYVRGAQAALAQGGKALDFGPLPVAGP